MSKNLILHKRMGTAIFFIAACLDLLAVAFHYSLLEVIVKPLLMTSLMYVYWKSCSVRNTWYLTALFFSFLGDVLLLDKEHLFLFGIAAFMITQLIYIRLVVTDIKRSNGKLNWVAGIPFLLYLTVLIGVLQAGLGAFLIPVLIYGIAISLFGSVSLMRYLLRPDRAARYLLTGSLLFILSDSMIALNKFHVAHKVYPLAIMATYILAQYLIYRYMAHSCEPE